MNINTLQERIQKAEAKVERKRGTIVKKNHRIDKLYVSLKSLGVEDPIKMNIQDFLGHENYRDIYCDYSDIETLRDDIKRGLKEIEQTNKTIEKYQAQLETEIKKETILTEIPEVFKTLQSDIITEWNDWDFARKERLKKTLASEGYNGFFEKGYTHTDYYFIQIDDEKIIKRNTLEAKEIILDLYNRVHQITGEVTDWNKLTVTRGSKGMLVLNGTVIGKEGRAEVESILAGGYNIQRLHIRVLVKELV